MANFIYNKAKKLIADGDLDLNTAAGIDLRVVLVMTNTTCDTEEEASTFADFTTPDVYDGSGYADQIIVGEATTWDSANDRTEMDGNDVTFSSLGAGTRQCQAAVIIDWQTTRNDSFPIAYIDTGGFPFDGNGGDVTIQWNAEGILQVT